MEEIAGRVYIDVGTSAREVGLLILWHRHPNRISEDELVKSIKRHRYLDANAKMAVNRLRGVVDDDGNSNLLLRNQGLREAEELVAARNRKTCAGS